MLAGGTTETISHFAGLFRLIDDVIRLRDLYEDPAHVPHLRPWDPDPHPDAPPDRPLEELPSQPRHVTLPPSDDRVQAPHFHAPHDKLPGMPHPGPFHMVLPGVPPVSPDFGAPDLAVQAVGADHAVPDQELIQLGQINAMHSDDVIVMVPGTEAALAALHAVDGPATIAALGETAVSLVPASLELHSTDTGDLVAGVAAHDAAEPAAGDPGFDHLPLGTYVDGALQPTGTRPDFSVPPLPSGTATPHDGLVDQGQDAETGNNLSINIATILDDHTQHTALIAEGNVYSTDAVIQSNILVSHAEIDVAGLALAQAISPGDNSAHNSAAITQTDIAAPSQVGHLSVGTQVAVDVVNGDFYDVKGVNQVNDLSDNDSIVQANFGGYYTASAGANAQVNEIPINELNGNYDLIVVQGDVHTANLIYQSNILLNDSTVKMLSGRGDDALQQVNTGANAISNTAEIDHYGSTVYQKFDMTLAGALNDLAHGQLDPGLAALLPASTSGPLHVLYVTGSFYDLNVIAQTNVLSNLDTVIQYAPHGGEGTAPTGQPTGFAQIANTGDNHLGNYAAIATVGATSNAQYVGGAHYSQAMLFQSNIIGDSSHVVTGDGAALAPDIAAFTGLSGLTLGDLHTAPTVTAEAAHHDDLFHGMLS